MIRRRFSLVSVSAMIVAAVFATFATMRAEVGFAGHQGFPFAWYWWTDLQVNYNPTQGFLWGGLVADVLVWLFVVIAFGLLVEWVVKKCLKQHGAKDA